NTYTGTTTVGAGTLKMGASGSLANSTVNITSFGTFDLNNQSKTIGNISGVGPTVLGSGSLSFGNNNSSTSYSGVISGTRGITKVGTGTTNLNGANTFSGVT